LLRTKQFRAKQFRAKKSALTGFAQPELSPGRVLDSERITLGHISSRVLSNSPLGVGNGKGNVFGTPAGVRIAQQIGSRRDGSRGLRGIPTLGTMAGAGGWFAGIVLPWGRVAGAVKPLVAPVFGVIEIIPTTPINGAGMGCAKQQREARSQEKNPQENRTAEWRIRNGRRYADRHSFSLSFPARKVNLPSAFIRGHPVFESG
jgi:hypothetical protein